jgi:uncharacterized protein (UPF0335 family)
MVRKMTEVSEKLESYIERLENLHAEIKDLKGDIKLILKEAKSEGLEPKALKAIVSMKKKGLETVREEMTTVEMYCSAIGIEIS